MFSLAEALDFVESSKWAYRANDGQLRCPDCNSIHECEEGWTAFPMDEREGATVVTTELCSDCGVVLAEDEACAPWELCSQARQDRIRQNLFA
jgi:hypothetical protein